MKILLSKRRAYFELFLAEPPFEMISDLVGAKMLDLFVSFSSEVFEASVVVKRNIRMKNISDKLKSSVYMIRNA